MTAATENGGAQTGTAPEPTGPTGAVVARSNVAPVAEANRLAR